ncbi:glutamate receptor ionotropic, kainate 2-like [Tachypleus tridentatus]|uniref:glutamate receptor ionotropic, kainate 2-like n=1 Tax=Tachypleus tridentatus TaxID=6853 RepID=UPI003FD67B13
MSFVPQSENWTVSQTIWYFFGALTQQGGAEHIPQKGTVRMVVSAFWAFAIIIMAGFSGTLTSFINVPGFNKAVDNIPDLVQKIQVGEYKAGTVEGSSILKILSDATQGYLFNIGQAMKADPKNSVVRSIQQGVNETIYRNYALVFTKAPMEAEVAALGISRFRFSTDQFFSAYYAIAIPTGSPMKELLDVFVFKCMEAGLVEFWKNRFWIKNTIKSFFSNKEATLPADTKVPAPVSVTDMQGAFIILGAGYNKIQWLNVHSLLCVMDAINGFYLGTQDKHVVFEEAINKDVQHLCSVYRLEKVEVIIIKVEEIDKDKCKLWKTAAGFQDELKLLYLRDTPVNNDFQGVRRAL